MKPKRAAKAFEALQARIREGDRQLIQLENEAVALAWNLRDIGTWSHQGSIVTGLKNKFTEPYVYRGTQFVAIPQSRHLFAVRELSSSSRLRPVTLHLVVKEADATFSSVDAIESYGYSLASFTESGLIDFEGIEHPTEEDILNVKTLLQYIEESPDK